MPVCLRLRLEQTRAGGRPLRSQQGLRHEKYHNGRFLQQPVANDRLLAWVDLFGEEGVDLGCELVRLLEQEAVVGVG